jgi:hypothetical protein
VYADLFQLNTVSQALPARMLGGGSRLRRELRFFYQTVIKSEVFESSGIYLTMQFQIYLTVNDPDTIHEEIFFKFVANLLKSLL